MKQIHIMIRSLSLWFLLIALFSLSCSRSTMDVPEYTPKDASFTFKLDLPRLGAPRTYANDPSVAKDNEVEKVTILVFEAKSDSTGKFLYSRANSDISTDNKFTVSLQLSAVAVRIHVFANPPMDFATPLYNMTTSEKTVLTSLETSHNLNASTSYTLPMHGCLELTDITIGDIDETVKLLRSVARVDVQIQDSILPTRFKLHGMAVYFTPDKGRLVSTSELEGTDPNLSISAPTMPASHTILQTKGNVPRAVVATAGDKVIANNLFIYENIDFTKITGSTDNNSRIVVAGYYDNSTELSYYPIDFKRTDAVSSDKDFMAVLRNHQYILNVTNVTGAGYKDEEDAAKSASADITASIIDWTQIGQDIIFDGVNHFYIESKQLLLFNPLGYTGYLSAGSNIDPKDWDMRWGSVGDYTTTATSVPMVGDHFTVLKPSTKQGGSFKFTTKETVSSDAKDTLYIRVANRLKMQIIVTQSPKDENDWNPDGDHEIEL